MSSPPPVFPAWPATPPSAGQVVLRPFGDGDAGMVQELATDPYVPLIGTLPANGDRTGALEYIARQRQRFVDGTGFSFAVARAGSGEALGMMGLWLRDRAVGRAQVGYAVAPSARGTGVATDALRALVPFAWTLPEIHRLELHIEPWNTASARAATSAGFRFEGLLRSYLEIGGRRRDLSSFAIIRALPPIRESSPRTDPGGV